MFTVTIWANSKATSKTVSFTEAVAQLLLTINQVGRQHTTMSPSYAQTLRFCHPHGEIELSGGENGEVAVSRLIRQIWHEQQPRNSVDLVIAVLAARSKLDPTAPPVLRAYEPKWLAEAIRLVYFRGGIASRVPLRPLPSDKQRIRLNHAAGQPQSGRPAFLIY